MYSGSVPSRCVLRSYVEKEASKCEWKVVYVEWLGLIVTQCCIVVYRLSRVVVTQAVQIASNSYGKIRKSQTHVDNRMPASLESCATTLETN